MKLFQRVKAEFAQDGDFDTGNAKYKGYERYSVGWTDWRALYGSPGASNADNNGTMVCQSAAVALTASQTTLSWEVEIISPLPGDWHSRIAVRDGQAGGEQRRPRDQRAAGS
jgi:hypothetical protein